MDGVGGAGRKAMKRTTKKSKGQGLTTGSARQQGKDVLGLHGQPWPKKMERRGDLFGRAKMLKPERFMSRIRSARTG